MLLLFTVLGCAPSGSVISNDDTADSFDSGLGDTGDTGELSDTADDGTDDTDDLPDDPVVEDFSVTGPSNFSTASITEDVDSCSMEASVYTPTGGGDALVVLSHGFSRTQANMVVWAEHFASWGFEVITPDLCHSSFIDSDHEQNAIDIVDLADAHADGRDVLYVGHSAGGLSSVLAAGFDTNAVGALGLDLTDDSAQAVTAAGSLSVPIAGLVGASSSCNASNNGTAVFDAASNGAWLRLNGSDHCDYESPTDWTCTILCDNGDSSQTDEEIASTIVTLSTAWLRWQTGDAAASAYWTPGETEYEALKTAGAF